MSNGPGKWVKKSAFVMPELPASLNIDPTLAALLHVTTFLEFSGDDSINPDDAVEAIEHVGLYIHRLPAQRLVEMREQVARVAGYATQQKWSEEVIEFFSNFVDNFGPGEDDE